MISSASSELNSVNQIFGEEILKCTIPCSVQRLLVQGNHLYVFTISNACVSTKNRVTSIAPLIIFEACFKRFPNFLADPELNTILKCNFLILNYPVLFTHSCPFFICLYKEEGEEEEEEEDLYPTLHSESQSIL
ncbi:UNVERIFIED_CONTAM: hypothetical protein K2H54_043634 [Gekko kuhli]